jgi:hypothetical protein
VATPKSRAWSLAKQTAFMSNIWSESSVKFENFHWFLATLHYNRFVVSERQILLSGNFHIVRSIYTCTSYWLGILLEDNIWFSPAWGDILIAFALIVSDSEWNSATKFGTNLKWSQLSASSCLNDASFWKFAISADPIIIMIALCQSGLQMIWF